MSDILGRRMGRLVAIAAGSAALIAGSIVLQAARQTPPGVISGTVTDELNRPVPGVKVTAFRLTASGDIPADQIGESPVWPTGRIQKETNDLGEFRLWPLEAGEYVVAVVVSRFTLHVSDNVDGCVAPDPPASSGFVPSVRAERVDALTDASRQHFVRIENALTPPAATVAGERGYVTTFAPRATDLAAARRVILADKEQAAGVDIQLQLRPSVTVTGRIVGMTVAAHLDVELLSTLGGARTRTRTDGSFVFLNVPTGSYVLVQPPRMVTKGQKRYLTSLTHNLMGGDPDLLAAIDTMTFDQAKKALDILTKLPAAQHRPKIAEATGVKTVERPEREPIVEGMYRDPDGTVIKVQVAHHGSGKLYAKRLVVLDQPRELKNGKVAGGEFVYTAGLINKVQPEWRMTLDEAMEWGQLYGICCRCGTVLTDDQPGGSIERGIGPVCAKKF